MIIYVIGCGGVGSWAVEKLMKWKPNHLWLIDGDVFEEKNMDRQLFDEDHLGMNKAEALAEKHGINGDCTNQYFTLESAERETLESDDILLCCADNHACRLAVLEACDLYYCRAVIAANEYIEAEAYWYEDSMKGTPNDPRVFYPDIRTDRSGDPLSPIGCVEASKEHEQLVLANDMASSLMLSLLYFHLEKRPDMDSGSRDFFPIHHKSNELKLQTIRWGDRK